MLHAFKPTGNHGESRPLSDADLHTESMALLLSDERNHSDEGSSDSDAQRERDYAAFRTITTFLHIIQKWPDLRRSNIQERDASIWPSDRLVLKLCNAFALLSVIQHGVVAVGVGFHLDGDQDMPVEILLTGQTFNENPRKRHLAALDSLNEDVVCKPNPPDALKAADNDRTDFKENFLHYLKKLKVTR